MDLRERKLKHIEPQAQAVLFDKRGNIIESDDCLVEIGKNKNVFRDTLFFQGMEELMTQMKLGDELKFDCVSLSLFDYESNFDFIIQRILIDDSEVFCWLIFDFADQYKKVLELQQERNVKAIESQKLERNQRRIINEKEAIESLYKELKDSNSSEYVLLKSDNLLVNVDLKEIDYFEAYGDYVKVITPEKTYVIHNKMKNLEETLPNTFFRVHRSFIVQIGKIRNIEQMSLDVNGDIIPVGQNQKQGLLSKMKKL